MDYHALIAKQQDFFASGATRSIPFRLQQLEKLKSLIQQHESNITAALHADLHKSPIEAVSNEVILLLKEINFFIKHLKSWSKPYRVRTPFFLWPGHSDIYFEPYGCVLIIGPWNYPFMLNLSPLVGAIGAGNCAVIKPSESAPHTEQLILNLINQYFSPDYVTAVSANPEEITTLLLNKFDCIFFIGSK